MVLGRIGIKRQMDDDGQQGSKALQMLSLSDNIGIGVNAEVISMRKMRQMKTLRVGIATYEEMKARSMALVRGDAVRAPEAPRVWFPSVESFAKVLSRDNQDLLRLIREHGPKSLDELAALSGRRKSNLSRTLKTMESYGLVELRQGEGRRLVPKVAYENVRLDLTLAGDEFRKG